MTTFIEVELKNPGKRSVRSLIRVDTIVSVVDNTNHCTLVIENAREGNNVTDTFDDIIARLGSGVIRRNVK